MDKLPHSALVGHCQCERCLVNGTETEAEVYTDKRGKLYVKCTWHPYINYQGNQSQSELHARTVFLDDSEPEPEPIQEPTPEPEPEQKPVVSQPEPETKSENSKKKPRRKSRFFR